MSSKLDLAKRKVDGLINLPGTMLRKGVAREGDPLTGFVDYNFKLLRDADRRWILYVEWVDLDGDGNRVVLPHSLVTAILQRVASVMAQARKERAQRGAHTRKHKVVDEAQP